VSRPHWVLRKTQIALLGHGYDLKLRPNTETSSVSRQATISAFCRRADAHSSYLVEMAWCGTPRILATYRSSLTPIRLGTLVAVARPSGGCKDRHATARRTVSNSGKYFRSGAVCARSGDHNPRRGAPLVPRRVVTELQGNYRVAVVGDPEYYAESSAAAALAQRYYLSHSSVVPYFNRRSR
jgi:hypothetical protein